MNTGQKRYSNGEVTIVWQQPLCIHSAKCFHGLPAVFDPGRRPWVDPHGAPTEQLVAQVKNCPSGALSIETAVPQAAPASTGLRIEVLKDGPLLIKGALSLVGADGVATERSGSTALCRCGGSKNKPFCDGTHNAIGFKG